MFDDIWVPNSPTAFRQVNHIYIYIYPLYPQPSPWGGPNNYFLHKAVCIFIFRYSCININIYIWNTLQKSIQNWSYIDISSFTPSFLWEFLCNTRFWKKGVQFPPKLIKNQNARYIAKNTGSSSLLPWCVTSINVITSILRLKVYKVLIQV